MQVLKYLVKLVRHESYTNSGSTPSPFLQKQLKQVENFRNNRIKLGKSTRNNKTNRK